MANLSAPIEVLLLTESDGFFGQRRMPWESMDVDVIAQILSKKFHVKRATYHQVAQGLVRPKGSIIIHSSSQQPEYKSFIDDVLLYLHGEKNILVPSIHAVRSHENKGYQELHKRLRGVQAPAGVYVGKVSELDRAQVSFPIVFKDLAGFGSSGVRLVRNETELEQATQVKSKPRLRDLPKIVKSQAGYLVRKHVLRRKNLRPYGNYYQQFKRFVLQRYIPDLTYDFKVLIFERRAFALKRNVAANDFRASGSGKFVFEDPPIELLDTARRLLLQFDEPYLSIDVCFDGSRYHLIEFQGVHFGPYTLLNAPKHFLWEGAQWVGCTQAVTLEEVIGESLVLYLDKVVSREEASN
jgi:glutathione synthase/RimK-type ligase-like ATP-grasp enzyme